MQILKTKKLRTSWIAGLLMALSMSGQGRAALIFSNFDTKFGEATVNGPGSGVGQPYEASAFTPSSDALFGSVSVGAYFFAGTSAFVLQLASDSSGLPGSILESLPVSLPAFGDPHLATAFSSIHTALSAGTQYWIVMGADPGNPTGRAAWELVSGAGGADYNSSWFPERAGAPMIEVNSYTAAAPEPVTAGLIGFGLAAAALFRKFRRDRMFPCNSARSLTTS